MSHVSLNRTAARPLGTVCIVGPAPGADLHGRGDGRDGAREARERERKWRATGKAGAIVDNSDGQRSSGRE